MDKWLLDVNQVCLVVVDLQDSLFGLIDRNVVRKVVSATEMMINVFQNLQLPILWTEQYRKGLGPTTPSVGVLLKNSLNPIDKVEFSCMQVPEFKGKLSAISKNQIIVVGMETHVCILQTVADLLESGYCVHVCRDAVMSRKKEDWKVGLKFMKKMGAMITTSETALFQLYRKAGTKEFKYFSQLLKEAETKTAQK